MNLLQIGINDFFKQHKVHDMNYTTSGKDGSSEYIAERLRRSAKLYNCQEHMCLT